MAITLVQHAGGSSATNTVTITLAATGGGNALIVVASSAIGAGTDANLASITLGGSAAGWASQLFLNGDPDNGGISIWADFSIAGGQTSLVVAAATGNTPVMVDVFEVSGLATTAALDKTVTNQVNGAGATWTSDATATTSQAAEFVVGTVSGFNNAGGTFTFTGPSSPWTDEAQLSPGTGIAQVSGYQIAASEAAFTYSGTATTTSPNLYYVAVTATFKGAGTPQAGPVFRPLNRAVRAQQLRRPLQGRIRSNPGGPASTTNITSTGKIAFQPFGMLGFVPGTYSGLMDDSAALLVLDAILLQAPVSSAGGLTLRLGGNSPAAAVNMTELLPGNGYTQGGQPFAFSAASAGTAVSSTAVSWTNTGGGWEITGLEFWDESERPDHQGIGIRWLFADWSGNPVAVAAGNTFAIPVSGLSVSLD